MVSLPNELLNVSSDHKGGQKTSHTGHNNDSSLRYEPLNGAQGRLIEKKTLHNKGNYGLSPK
jgi:hypothetical protein